VPGIAYVGGRFVDEGAATVPLATRGLLFGEGLFETIPVRNGQPFRLVAHLDRMAAGAALLDLGFLVPLDELAIAIAGVIEQNRIDQGLVKAVVAAGPAPGGPPIVAVLVPPPRPVPAAWRAAGAPVATSPVRHDAARLVPRTKATGALDRHRLAREADLLGAADVLLLDPGGHVAEGARSSIFWVRHGRLRTPSLDLGILPGITRAAALECARAAAIPVEEGRFDLADLASATEAFLTNVRFGVLPVGAVDGVARAAPGPVTIRLAVAYDKLVERETSPEGAAPHPAQEREGP